MKLLLASDSTVTLYVVVKGAVDIAYDVIFDNVRVLPGTSPTISVPPNHSLQYGVSRHASTNPTYTGDVVSSPLVQAVSRGPRTKSLAEGTILFALNLTADICSSFSPLLAQYIYEARSVNGDSAWNVVTASSGALNHLFGIVRVADVARKKTCERRPIHQSKIVQRTPSWYLPGSSGCQRQRSSVIVLQTPFSAPLQAAVGPGT